MNCVLSMYAKIICIINKTSVVILFIFLRAFNKLKSSEDKTKKRQVVITMKNYTFVEYLIITI